jgi:hypothetical protein
LAFTVLAVTALVGVLWLRVVWYDAGLFEDFVLLKLEDFVGAIDFGVSCVSRRDVKLEALVGDDFVPE